MIGTIIPKIIVYPRTIYILWFGHEFYFKRRK